jgi:pyruvate-formate lyase-activating enzyme
VILFIEPISKNIGMYVPAYPLPLMEIGSFVKSNRPESDIGVISIPVDYGLPLTQEGKEQINQRLLKDISEMKPKGVGISCTAISQAEEMIQLCELIKGYDPDIFIFLGGYFPTVYHEEIWKRTSAVDVIVMGEGEVPSLKIIERLENGKNPLDNNIPNLSWKQDGKIHHTEKSNGFNLNEKAPLNLELLRYPRAYDILPYAFSRGCTYQCHFCMENLIRPSRTEVPYEIIRRDLNYLAQKSNAHTLLISDALFHSFHLFPLIRSLNMKVNFETRCEIMDPSLLGEIADICGTVALGFESASYSTLKRMNKVKDRAHYESYLSNTISTFKAAVKNNISIVVFMIAGYPGDTREDLQATLDFAKDLAHQSGPGGHIFKIGECRAYPKTKIYDLASSLSDCTFSDDGFFGENIITRPSSDLDFDTVLAYMDEIFALSNITPKMQHTILGVMPFFRIPAQALRDEIVPDSCYIGKNRGVFNIKGDSLETYRALFPRLAEKYKKWMSDQRSRRDLNL